MKILCVCAGGSCRSVTFATLLKYYWGHDALAASAEKNAPETLRMLYEWASAIIVVDEEFLDVIPAPHDTKVSVLKIGEDRWGMSMHPHLVPICYELLVKEFGPPERRKTVAQIVARRGKYMERQEKVGGQDKCIDYPELPCEQSYCGYAGGIGNCKPASERS